MFAKLHLLSQDEPEGGGGLRWRAHPYLRLVGAVPRGPAVFEWSRRQRDDLEALWRDPTADGARERLAGDLAAFCAKLGWTPDAELLADAEKHGDDYLVTLSAVPPELYLLPWEVIRTGAAGAYLSDYASVQVRYAVPGLAPREILAAPPRPGVLFAWSAAGGAVPHEAQAAAIRAAAAAGGVVFQELAEVDERSLQAALDAGPPPSVLHLLCHGSPGAGGEPPRLAWGASDQRSEITATRLARMLRRHSGAIRLVVLSACGGGDGLGDPLFISSLAQELHKKGIPNVVASRYPLSVPGARALTRALYDKLLREAWSLERALRHTREALLRAGDDGESHPGDGYGIQLYANDTERFRSDNEVEAERPVLASYPFGTAARPVPASAPPPADLTLGLDADPGLTEDQLAGVLRRVSEDAGLTVASATPAAPRALRVRTTVDGAQRLLGAWRSNGLRSALGVIVGQLIVTKGITPALAGNLSAAAGQAKAAATAGHTATAAAGNTTAAATGKATAVVAGKLVAAKLALAAVIGSAAVAAGGVATYRAQPHAAVSAAPLVKEGLASAGPADAGLPDPVASDPGPPDAAPAEAAPPAAALPGTPPPPVAPHRATPHRATPGRAGSPVAAPLEPAPPVAVAPVVAPPELAPPVAVPPPAAAPVCGNGAIEPGEQCDDGNTRDRDGCSSICRLELIRLSGTTQVMPSEDTQSLMRRDRRDGAASVKGSVGLCVATTGRVTAARLERSTGYPAYDQALLAAVRAWRYQPYARPGTAVACTTVTFEYPVDR